MKTVLHFSPVSATLVQLPQNKVFSSYALNINVCSNLNPMIPDEVTIMELIDKGQTNNEVALAIKLSSEMVAHKLDEMFKMAGVNNKTELVKWWRNQTIPATNQN